MLGFDPTGQWDEAQTDSDTGAFLLHLFMFFILKTQRSKRERRKKKSQTFEAVVPEMF